MKLTRRSLLAAAALPAVPAEAATAPLAAGARLKPEREGMIAVPGGRVYVRINGDLGGPRAPIVMVHGGPGSSHWYFLNGTALADERAVILYDQLDSGRSDHPGTLSNWNVQRFVEELDAVRRGLGVERWHVLGASWGGTVALEYAAGRPQALASTIMQSPLVSTELWMRDARRLVATMPATTRRLLAACDTPGAAPKEACDAATEAFYARYVRLREPPPEVAAYRAALPRSFSADVYNHLWGRAEFTASGLLRDYEGRPLLKHLDGRRTLFVAGEHDEALPSTVAAFAKAARSPYRTVPDAAHTIMNDNPAGYLAVLRPWLAAHD